MKADLERGEATAQAAQAAAEDFASHLKRVKQKLEDKLVEVGRAGALCVFVVFTCCCCVLLSYVTELCFIRRRHWEEGSCVLV